MSTITLLTKQAIRQFGAVRLIPSTSRPLSTRWSTQLASEKLGDAEPLVLYEKRGSKKQIGLITLNRRKALNALSIPLVDELVSIIEKAEKDNSIGALVLTGSVKAFAAGADIKEMSSRTFSQCIHQNLLSNWEKVANCQKPIIGAVNGYALGGGCELAMMCDIIYAGDNAKFGQPEITIGTIPGGGGTQRLTKAIGKSRSMEMCLTGLPIDAHQAAAWGLVSKVVPADTTVDEAIKLAEKITSYSSLIVTLCKESILNSYETSLAQGIKTEKRFFQATFATADQKEGMAAFAEKRAPTFTGN